MTPSRVCAAVLVALLAGCGSDSDSPDPSPLPGSPSDTDAAAAPDDAGSPAAPADGSIDDGFADDDSAPDDTVPPPSSGATALIAPGTYETILREIVAIANEGALDAASARVRTVLDGFEDPVRQVIDTGAASGDGGLAFVSFEPRFDDGGPSGDYTFSCGNGGSVTVESVDGSSAGGPFITRMATDGTCAIGDDAYEGTADTFRPPVRTPYTDTFERFSITRADGDSLALDGEYFTEFDEVGVFFETGWNGASLASVDAGETTRVEGYTSLRRSVAPSELVEEPPSVAADVRFSVTAPWSSNETLDVSVDLAHANPELVRNDAGGPYPAQWSTGTLRVTAPDGSGLTLSPETGDPATFSIAFDGEDDGEPVVRDWADGFQVRCSALFDCR